MNYQKIYNQIIERAKNRILEGYKEKHHIIPKCLGGEDNKENLVELTAREHFLCHMLLCEIYPDKSKLWYALFLMSIGKKKRKENQHIISSRTYERIKNEWQSVVKNKPKPEGFMSAALKEKISKSNKGISRNKGRELSKEIKQKISDKKKGKPLTQQHVYNLRIGLKNRKKWIKPSRKVEQYDLEGNFIKEWESVTEVNKHMSGDIRACCCGKQKTACNYIWKYKN
jgi:hypothetical protein